MRIRHIVRPLALLLPMGLVSPGVHGQTPPAATVPATPAPIGPSAPVVGGTPGLSQVPTKPAFGDPSLVSRRHFDLTGKTCISVAGFARAQTMNPNIFTHMVSATNRCAGQIKVNVCYYQSRNCVPLTVGGYQKAEAVLGIMPAMRDFRFEYEEKFN